jgi:hypothetical protein
MSKPSKEDENLRRLLKMKPEPFTPKKDKSKASPAAAKKPRRKSIVDAPR